MLNKADSAIVDLVWTYASGVDREGSNIKSRAREVEDEKLAKLYPGMDLVAYHLSKRRGMKALEEFVFKYNMQQLAKQKQGR